jgi:hypothetical protein
VAGSVTKDSKRHLDSLQISINGSLGFGIVSVDPKTKLFYHQKIHILEVGGKLSCMVNGKRFEG